MSSTLFVLMAAFVAAAGCAQADTLNFEDLAVGTTVNAQYGPRGAVFRDAYLDSDPHASSGTRVLRSIPPTAEVFTPAPLAIVFPSPQTHVAFHAGNFPGGGAGTLKVFNSGGAVIGQDGPRAVPSGTFATVFEVKLTAPGHRPRRIPDRRLGPRIHRRPAFRRRHGSPESAAHGKNHQPGGGCNGGTGPGEHPGYGYG